MKILWRRGIASLLACPILGTNNPDLNTGQCQWRDEGESANPRYVLTVLGALNGLFIPCFRCVLLYETDTWRLRLAKKWW